MGALAPVLARRGMLSRGLRLPLRGLGSRRGAAQGQLVEVLAGGSCFPWGKGFTLRFLFPDVLHPLWFWLS